MILTGTTVNLKLVNENDATFICSLRNNNKLNQFISSSSSDVKKQIEWIKNYKQRERNQTEFYFIISRLDDSRKIGTVRLYDFITDISSFCWGSWILNQDKTISSAIESALLVYQFGFNHLGFTQSHFDVRKLNKAVQNFHVKMGAEQIKSDENDVYFTFSKESYEFSLQKYQKYLPADWMSK